MPLLALLFLAPIYTHFKQINGEVGFITSTTLPSARSSISFLSIIAGYSSADARFLTRCRHWMGLGIPIRLQIVGSLGGEFVGVLGNCGGALPKLLV